MGSPRPRWRPVLAGFLLFGGVGLVFMFGAGLLGLGGPAAVGRWIAATRGPWALPAVVASFAALAFLGVPQFVLIAAAVAAFGPWAGAAYSWVGTLVSALVGFGLARAWSRRQAGFVASGTVSKLMRLIARNGFVASLVIRLAPFAPFVAVNMAAGLTPIGVMDFTAGTAIGIVPKIALTALAGDSVARAAAGGAWGVTAALLALVAGLWVAAGLAARRWMKP